MMQICKAIPLSKTDYGAQIYNSASDYLLYKLQIIKTKHLEFAHAPKTTSGENLEVEFNIMPLTYSQKLQILKYYSKENSLV